MPRPYRRLRYDPIGVETARHRCELPAERRASLPFVVGQGLIIAPWAPDRQRPEDLARLDAVIDQLGRLPAPVCWCWPDRDPTPVQTPDSAWLAAWGRDRACFRLEPVV